MFLVNVGPDWHKFSSLREVVETVGSVTLLQFVVALVALSWLVPSLLDKGRVWAFAVLFLLLLVVAAELNVLLSYFYLEPAYPDSYGASYAAISSLGLMERMGFSSMIKYIVFSKLPFYFFPAAMLIAVNYYQKQQSLLQLREQKRAAELGALKNQLNPHFIFNTLNNIYALAIKGSHRTAEAVAKLSEILDYVLRRSSIERVSLQDEVEMIEAYIALELLRFGDRVTVTFENNASGTHQVPPLLFLTLLENAFKHGASQELKKSLIDVRLDEVDKRIEFVVSNTKPTAAAAASHSEKIGLSNLRRQLALLFPDSSRLTINETTDRYSARLSLDAV
ncbi:MAG: histidine kinase [Pseudomonadota bacterium]